MTGDPGTPEEAVSLAEARARERLATGEYADAGRLEALADRSPRGLDRLVEWAAIEVAPKSVRSTRRLGAPVTAFKRFLVRMLVQYHNEQEAQITRFNVHLVAHLGGLEARLRGLERRVESLERSRGEQ